MAPNWFIAFPMQVEGLRLVPEPPPRVRVFPNADLHCTLSFLGSVTEADARSAWSRVPDLVRSEAVAGSFDEVRPLGNPRKPSALSAMVGEGREPLSAMIARARTALLEAAGAPPDDRPPLPHMTLARIQRRASSGERKAAVRWAQSLELGDTSFLASSVALYTWADDRRERLFQIVEQRALGS
ncbi:MAG: 2'-5' RNA ligase family protein [Myxococcales bacterium]|nr:2'-5' RNA ligase family protein [Myxococcales bacterium]